MVGTNDTQQEHPLVLLGALAGILTLVLGMIAIWNSNATADRPQANPLNPFGGPRLNTVESTLLRVSIVDGTPTSTANGKPNASTRFVTLRGSGRPASGTALYVVVKVEEDDGGYFVAGRPHDDPRGGWYCDVSLGSPLESDRGQYAAFLVAARPAEQAALSKYVRERLATDSKGIGTDFPETLNGIGNQMTLIREKSPRVLHNSRRRLISDNLIKTPVNCENPYANRGS
jgi:hypothetical protein